jgi:hypothetical protein
MDTGEGAVIEIRKCANGWIVTPTVMDKYSCAPSNPEEEWFVFNNWGDLVRHIKKQLKLREP